MRLLHYHVHTHHPDAKIHIIRSWKNRNLEDLSFEKRIGLRNPYEPDRVRYFLFDDGESCYWDDLLNLELVQRRVSSTRDTLLGDLCGYYDQFTDLG